MKELKAMKELKRHEIKQIQMDILNVVTEFCNKNDIKYFLCGGTLIGAVRHQGYIPWDDDIDIALLRSDYEKLINNFNTYKELYKVYELNNTGWYPYPFAKAYFVNSIIKEANDNLSCNVGINIDIFPIDNLPDDINKQRKLLKEILRQRNILDIKAIKINKKRAFYKNVILFIGKRIYKQKKPNTIALNIAHLATKYMNSEVSKVGIIVWGYGKCEIVRKNIFNETIKMKFEDYEYTVPKEYDEWLSSIYGDYMKLPPTEKQISHHDFEAYLTDK